MSQLSLLPPDLAPTASYNVQGFSNLRAGYDDASARFELPIIYPSNTEYGIVTPDDAFYSYFWQTGSLKYYVNYADFTVHAFPSAALATAHLGSNIAPLCLESVASGGTPGKCAASFPKQSGPSYLYATGDGGADGGYVSVNSNTGKITWTRTTVSVGLSPSGTALMPSLLATRRHSSRRSSDRPIRRS